jgi:glycosyltransferase involved in cell wall biosynthesis
MDRNEKVTVIICTLARKSRSKSLLAAITSINEASSKKTRINIIVNGQEFDQNLLSELKTKDFIKIIHEDLKSLPNAIYAGARSVKTPYFCFLDDDDTYLTGGLDLRLRAMEEKSETDLLVTNGLINRDNSDRICLINFEAAAKNPWLALYTENWLKSCNSMFRTSSFQPDFFEEIEPYFEWTWLANKICKSNKNIKFLNDITFIINDTPNSASKSEEYFLAYLGLYDRLLKQKPPKPIRRKILCLYGMELHARSDYYRRNRKTFHSWTYHFRSLFYPDGWKYLTYTRRLMFR